MDIIGKIGGPSDGELFAGASHHVADLVLRLCQLPCGLRDAVSLRQDLRGAIFARKKNAHYVRLGIALVEQTPVVRERPGKGDDALCHGRIDPVRGR